MQKITDIGSSFQSLPPNFQTAENRAFFYALDKQIKKLVEKSAVLNIWSDFEKIDPSYYDYIAVCLQAPYYRSDYSNSRKKLLIKTAIMTHIQAGTQGALLEILQSTFGQAQIIPWYEYNGQPYHFKADVSTSPSQADRQFFEDIIKKVKAARSTLDTIEMITRLFTDDMRAGVCIAQGHEIKIKKESLV